LLKITHSLIILAISFGNLLVYIHVKFNSDLVNLQRVDIHLT